MTARAGDARETPTSHGEALEPRVRRYVAAQATRVLTQLDRDPDSPTFGSFDRSHWHYKIHDFSSAILQQGLFTLEAIRTGQIAAGVPAAVVERWCLGAVRRLAGGVDRAGGVDEYYPFERSYPAAAFGLWSVCRVLADWRVAAPHLFAAVGPARLRRLAAHVAGRVEIEATNQQAAGLAGLALAASLDLLPDPGGTVERHARRLFAAQHGEGWFDEYGGPDCGYLTVTLDALVDYHDATGDDRALAAIDRAVGFLAGLVGADGRLPSTLNSRNTDYVVPYGLARTGARNALAAWLVQTLFRDIDDPAHAVWATDDRYQAHYIFASIVRCVPHLAAMRPAAGPTPAGERWLEGCGLWVYWPAGREWTAFVAARKGGLVRVHRGTGPAAVEHGWRIHAARRLWTTNWCSSAWAVVKEGGTLRVAGRCQRGRFHVATPLSHAALRLSAWLLRDRLIPLLKRAMIFRPGQADGPTFERVIAISDDGVRITDRIGARSGARAEPAPRQNLRHVASAGSFSTEEWQPSLLGSRTERLERDVTVETQWRPGPTA